MSKRHLFFLLLVSVAFLVAAGIPTKSQYFVQNEGTNKNLIADRNVNMVSGTTLPGGDPWLQRQNEPSIAVSTRNPLHLLAAANDYRTVDIPFSEGELPGPLEGTAQSQGDAWLGIFKSFDGGESWISTLLPGYPQSQDKSSLLYGYTAAADPIVRAGTDGLFYVCGIVFHRDPATKEIGDSAVFVARYIDNNNKEKGNTIEYLGAEIVFLGNPGQFFDKPWMAVDIPRQGSCGNVYVVSADFVGSKKNRIHGKVLFSRSTDCGKTWSNPVQLTDAGRPYQGGTIAIDPENGTVYVALRRFKEQVGKKKTSPDVICVAKSDDYGKKFSKAVEVAEINPFDQPTSRLMFRTNCYPAMTVDDNGIVYLAWSQRGLGPNNEARIVISTSPNGTVWSHPIPVESPTMNPENPGELLAGHQFMPTLTYANSKLMVAWYDQRNDVTKQFTKYIDETHKQFRHTIDVRIARGNPGSTPVFEPSIQVSRYIWVILEEKKDEWVLRQAQWNPPNFPLFQGGTTPFHGDYIDISPSPMFIWDEAESRWRFNTEPTDSPVFHVAWTDNRDVKPPSVSPWDWTNYTPPNSPQPGFDSTTKGPCPDILNKPGMRNQNIYTSRISWGLEVGTTGNSKPLNIPRAFVIEVNNTTNEARCFRLIIGDPKPEGQASFLQFGYAPKTELDVAIAPHSSISRPVFFQSSDPNASVRVDVIEIYEPGGVPVPGGLTSFIILNPGHQDAVIQDPDGWEDPSRSIENEEVYNPVIELSQIFDWSNKGLNPNMFSPNMFSPNMFNPNMFNTVVVNPNMFSPNMFSPNMFSPNMFSPNMFSPNMFSPNMFSPNMFSAAIPEGANLKDARVVDVVWTVTNEGNTTSSYTFKTFAKSAVPEGIYVQLIVYKTTYMPVTNGADCELRNAPQHELLANIINPNMFNPNMFSPNMFSPNMFNAAIENATFSIPPGEEVNVLLRLIEENPAKVKVLANGEIFDILEFAGKVGGGVTAQEVNTTDAQAGITTPRADATKLLIGTSSLPDGTIGVGYNQTLQAVGGNPVNYSWTLNQAALPPGLNYNLSGRIYGTPTTEGTYSFVVRVTDGTDEDTQALSITIHRSGVPAVPDITTTTLPSGVKNVYYGTTLSASGGKVPYVWSKVSGSLPNGLGLDDGGTISGRPTTEGTFGFTVKVMDAYGAEDKQPLTIEIRPKPTQNFTISGCVTKSDGTLLAGVLMRGLPGAPTTGTDGHYTATVPEGWEGTVTPFIEGYTFYPASQHYANITDNVTLDFTAYPPVDRFEFDTIQNQAVGVPFSITITAVDSDKRKVATYSDTNTLSDSTGTISPTSTLVFINGIWTGNVTISTIQSGVTITTSGRGKIGESNTFNVMAGVAEKIKIEDAADGTGTEVGAMTIAPGSSFTVYAISRDAGDNFFNNVAATWSLIDKTEGVLPTDLVPAEDNKSATFFGNAEGTAKIKATYDSLIDTTGKITVTSTPLDDSYEENDNRGSAAEITLGIPYPNLVYLDEDWYKVEITDAGKDLKVHISATSYPDPSQYQDLDFGIWNSSGKLLSYNLSGSDDETVYISGLAQGLYYIGINYFSQTGAVYSMTVEVGDSSTFGIDYISGKVVDKDEHGIEGIYVELYGEPFDWNTSRPLITTDSNGDYKIGYVPGDYKVRFNLSQLLYYDYDWASDRNYIGEYYDNKSSSAEASILQIRVGTPIAGINAELVKGGAITGTITDSNGGVQNVDVRVCNLSGTQISFASSDGNGQYTLERIPTGYFKVYVRTPSPDYGAEWYDNKPSFDDADPVSVAAGETTSGIDFQLEEGGRIAGRVTNSQGNPIQGVTVRAYDPTQTAQILLHQVSTNQNGEYSIGRLPNGFVKILFDPPGFYSREWYNNKRYFGEADLVRAIAGQTTPDINAQLDEGGAIIGHVTDPLERGLYNINVMCVNTESCIWYSATTDAAGNYGIYHIPPGNYKVRFRADYGNYVTEWYNDKGSYADAEPVLVEAGKNTTGINAQLSESAGHITGRVTADGAGIEGVRVRAHDSTFDSAISWAFADPIGNISWAFTDSNGNYSIPRMPTCNAKIFFDADSNNLNYASEWYDDESSHDVADNVQVTQGEPTSSINADLAGRSLLSITTAELSNGTAGMPYVATLEAGGGILGYHWSLASDSDPLPDGLSLHGNGVIDGTPIALTLNTFNFTVQVIDSSAPTPQTDTQSLSITITVVTPPDVTPPTVTSFNPADNATDVPLDANLVITFDENVVKRSGNIVIKKSSDDSVFETIPVTDTRVSISDNIVTIIRYATFEGLTGYYVQIATSCFEDAAGNPYAGINDNSTWNFTTESVAAASLVAYYPFNGNANDESGNANNGTVEGATLTPDRFGNANKSYSFDGENDGITIPSSASLNVDNFQNGYTIAAWVKPMDTSSFYYDIVSKGNNVFSIRLNRSSLEACHHSTGGTGCQTAGIDLSTGTWSFVAVTWNAPTGVWKMYHNGNPGSYTGNMANLIADSDGQISIGRDSQSDRWYFNGIIDDVRIYDRGLSESEIAKLYLDTALVAYYPFNGNANDESGNGNNGTVQEATLTTDRFGNANKAYSFDGVNDGITIPNSASLSVNNFQNGYTIAAWVKPMVTSSFYYDIVSKGNNAFSIRLNGSALEACHHYTDGTGCQTAGIDLSTGTWSFVAVTWNASTGVWQMYHNGNPGSYTGNMADLKADSDGQISIGRDCQLERWYFNGIIDDVRIYDRGLSESEIAKLYLYLR